MTTELVLPARPLQRFCDVVDALMEDKRWTEDVSALRYAASSLLTLRGDAKAVAHSLRALAHDLEQGAGWFGPLKSSVRFVVAAMLLQGGIGAATWYREVERIEGLFAERGLKRKTVYTHLAVLLLLDAARREGRSVDGALVGRFADLYAELKRHHRFLTGQDDYPACALLTGLSGPPSEVANRCERFYDGLDDLGFKRGNALQSVSHMLVFAPDPDDVVMRRFTRLYHVFDESGLWMHTGDYDEVAALSFLPDPAERVVTKVLEHREVLAKRKPRPGKEVSFSLACGTAFLELAGGDDNNEQLRGTQNALAVQAILQAQQAAMMAAAIAATTAASSASSS